MNNRVFKSPTLTKENALQTITELVNLYKEGHKDIIFFGPGIKIKPESVERLNDESYAALLTKMFDGDHASCKDVYMQKEYKTGFFEQENSVEQFKIAAQKLLVPLSTFFIDYPFNDK
jgi:exodeoxyribonuclease V gamma subunit